MMRNFLATHNVLAVTAATAEAAVNRPHAPDLAMLISLEDVLNIEHKRETNEDEAVGKEEPDTVYDRGGTATGKINFIRAQPQHVAWLLAYALGSCESANLDDYSYRHTITPIDGDVDEARSNPSFTAVQRLGSDVVKRLFGSCFFDQVELTAKADDWLKISGDIKGTGFRETNLVSEEVAGFADDTSVTLDANAVEGATAAARLNSIHRIEFMATESAYWQTGTATAVSDATPAVITVKALSGSHTAGTWRVLYVPDEDTSLDTGTATSDPPDDITGLLTDTGGAMDSNEHVGRWLVMTDGTASGRIWKITANAATTITCAGVNLYDAGVRSGDAYKVVQYGWLPLPARVSEPPMLVTALYVYMGGSYATGTWLGGWKLDAPLKELTWSFQNNLTPEFTPGSGVPDYADRALRSGRTQTLTINKDCRDWLMQQYLADDEYFAIRMYAEGTVIPDSSEVYRVEIIFPRVAVMKSEVGVTDKRVTESPELRILEDDTYGSVIVTVQNAQATYAA